MLPINNTHSVTTPHLDVWIQHHHKVLGNFTNFCSAEYLVPDCHPVASATTSGHGLWTEYECKVCCTGGRNLYIGSFKQKLPKKCSAEGKARGWWLAGSPLEWRILAGSAAIHKLQNYLREGEWKHPRTSYIVQLSFSAQTRACRASHRQSTPCLLLCYPSLPQPPAVTPSWSSSPFYFFFFFCCWAQDL